MNLEHEDYIEINNVDVETLPQSIAVKIDKIEYKLDAYEELESDDGDKAYNEIMGLSSSIKNDIEKHIISNGGGKDYDKDGVKVDSELDKLFNTGIYKYSIDEVKSKAPFTYNFIFEEYSYGGENGVITSNYSLIENEKENYTLKKT